MVSDDETFESLLLAGYVPLTDNGFALPCFATSPRPNTWYTAQTQIEGDHSSALSSFEEYRGPDVVRLPEALQQWIAIGEPWLDVFLLNGQPHVGSPETLWQALNDRALKDDAPPVLSLFELISAIPGSDRRQMAAMAVASLEHAHGSDAANRWRRATLRSDTQLQLRRYSPKARENVDLQAGVRLAGGDRTLVIEVPHTLLQDLEENGQLETWRSSVASLSRSLGLGVAGIVARGRFEDHSAAEPDLPPPPLHPENPHPRVLVLTTCRRSAEIGRLVTMPSWLPSWPGEKTASATPDGEVLVQALDSSDWYDEIFDAVVVLADTTRRDLRPQLSLLRKKLPGLVGTTVLAPALPKDRGAPVSGVHLHELAEFGIEAIVDTNLARSPFWPEGRGKSFDRSNADIAVAAGFMLARAGSLRRALGRSWNDLPILQYALTGPESSTDLRMVSEACLPAQGDFIYEERFSARGKRRTRLGVARLTRPASNFSRFAAEVLRDIHPTVENGVVHGPIPADEVAPDSLSATFGLGPGTDLDRLVVTSAVPTLDAFSKALTRGAWLTRYTDRDTLNDRLTPDAQRHKLPMLPRELDIGVVRSLPENRGIATRGVDVRDVVGLTQEQYALWRQETLRSPEHAVSLHPYRSDLKRDTQTATKFTHVASGIDVRAGLMSHDSTAHALTAIADWREPWHRSGSWPKRMHDLQAAFAPVPPKLRRYAISEGEMPVIVVGLDGGEIPAQSFFMIVGDRSVPALALSRVFQIWAYVTTTRSRGWPSRFTLSRTFEAFPLPRAMHVQPLGSEVSALTVEPSPLAAALEKFEDVARKSGAWPMPSSRPIDRTSFSPELLTTFLDRPFLAAYGLPVDASDLQILRHLLGSHQRTDRGGFYVGHSAMGDFL